MIDDDVIAYMHVHRLLHRHPEARDVNTLAPIAWDELHLGLGRGELREALKLLRLTGRLSQYRGKLRHRHTSHCAAERMRLPAEWEP
ncbi:MAG: hypothetical protein JOZ75_06365 [Candidatus Dormibacteraeota bacterium]|nr:hypothetical protein [Candidatus Dormibacteraeota bacterium]